MDRSAVFMGLLTFICRFYNALTLDHPVGFSLSFSSSLSHTVKKPFFFSEQKGQIYTHIQRGPTSIPSLCFSKCGTPAEHAITLKYQTIGHFLNTNALLIYYEVLDIIYSM